MIDWWGPVITEYYGSTEGSVITMIDSEQWMAKGGSVGAPMPGMEIIVVDDDGTRLRPERAGHALLPQRDGDRLRVPQRARRRPPTSTSSRACSPPATSATSTTTGYLWLSDRKIDMIISGGVNIYPAEIEGVLGGHDSSPKSP